MSRRVISWTGFTPTATTDSVDLVNATYAWFLQGQVSTQQVLIWEISIMGQAGSSSPTLMILGRDVQIGTSNGSTFTGGTMDNFKNPNAASLTSQPVSANNATTSKPQRSSTLHLENCNLNAFGGAYFIRANKQEECSLLIGNTASLGELSLSAYTGGTTGAIGGHTVYETI